MKDAFVDGDLRSRDAAYHQGTVWAWLIGPFIDAYRKVYPDSDSRVAEMLSALQSHLSEAGVGQISEIFDADAPHNPRGCPAQAWSVAEVLRVLKTVCVNGIRKPTGPQASLPA